MLIRKPSDIRSSEITLYESYKGYFTRRRFLRNALAGTAAAGGGQGRSSRSSGGVSRFVGKRWIPAAFPFLALIETTGSAVVVLGDSA